MINQWFQGRTYSAARPFMLLVASVSFGLGISLPLIQFEKLFFFSDTPSLLDVLFGLWNDGSLALAALVAVFSLLFPLAKLAIAYRAVYLTGHLPQWAGWLAKWSMMDVMLVAILVFAAKTSGMATALAQPGLWFYALSTLAAAAATAGLSKNH